MSLRLGNDREDFDRRIRYIVENPDIADAKTILRACKAAKAFDPASTRFSRLVSQMRFERRPHKRPKVGLEFPKVFNGLRRKDDGKRHSGQIIARIGDRQLSRVNPSKC